MSCRRDALNANESKRGCVLAVVDLGCARMQAHADANSADLFPALPMQRALGVECGGKRIRGMSEHRAKRIANDLEHLTATRDDGFMQQGVMAFERHLHRDGVILDETRRALDV